MEDKMIRRLFVDMDGTLAKFTPVEELEALYEEGYFRGLAQQKNVVDAVNYSAANADVYILSSCLTDSEYAWDEKRQWLKEYLPGLPEDKIIFTPCGIPKTDQSQWFSVRGGLHDARYLPISSKDVLLDDYTANLTEWAAAGGTGVKLVNDINHRKGVWKGPVADYMSSPEMIIGDIEASLADKPPSLSGIIQDGKENPRATAAGEAGLNKSLTDDAEQQGL
jgi:hypothetical protein